MNILKNKLALNIKIPATKEAILSSCTELKESHKRLECNHIFENIYLSGYNSASDLDFITKNKFTHIINCAKSSKSFMQIKFEHIEYLNLNVEDDPGFSILSLISNFIDFIENLNKNEPNPKILVHCFEGISRGPCLIVAYLIWKLKINKETAIKFIKEKRPWIEINLGFLYQLEKWSKLCEQMREEKNKHLQRKYLFKIKKNICKRNRNTSTIINKINFEEEYLLESKIKVIEHFNEGENLVNVIRVHNTNNLKDKNENKNEVE